MVIDHSDELIWMRTISDLLPKSSYPKIAEFFQARGITRKPYLEKLDESEYPAFIKLLEQETGFTFRRHFEAPAFTYGSVIEEVARFLQRSRPTASISILDSDTIVLDGGHIHFWQTNKTFGDRDSLGNIPIAPKKKFGNFRKSHIGVILASKDGSTIACYRFKKERQSFEVHYSRSGEAFFVAPAKDWTFHRIGEDYGKT